MNIELYNKQNKNNLEVTEPLIKRHEDCRKYLRSVSKEIGRGAHWEERSKQVDYALTKEGYIWKGQRINYCPPIYHKNKNYNCPDSWFNSMKNLSKKMNYPARKETAVKLDCFKINKRVFRFDITGCSNNYYFDRLNLEINKTSNVLEIGAGCGVLAALFSAEHECKYVIVDLPEMLTASSAFLLYTFPEKKISLPNEINSVKDIEGSDFTLLTPKQIEFIISMRFDLCINIASFMEMKNEEVKMYFQLVNKCLENNGYFFCSNRIKKHTNFFEYPWYLLNDCEDVFIERCRLMMDIVPRKNQFVDRLQIKNNKNRDKYNFPKPPRIIIAEILKQVIWRKGFPFTSIHKYFPYHWKRMPNL